MWSTQNSLIPAREMIQSLKKKKKNWLYLLNLNKHIPSDSVIHPQVDIQQK